MKATTEHSKKSVPVLLQSFGVVDNPQSNYSSRMKTKHHGNRFHSPPPSDNESHQKLIPNSSRQNFEQEEKVIQEHY
jgi:hypothetical protein